MIAYGIAVGSNVGDGLGNLQRGVSLLLERVPEARLTGCASLYETAPVDCAPGTPNFLNSVIEITAPLPPEAMHAHLMAVELALGRPVVRERNSPRTLDLDVLYAGDFVSEDPQLTVPHPRLHERRFVLAPLAEMRPTLVLPGFVQTTAQLLGELNADDGCLRIAVAGWPLSFVSDDARR